MLLYPYQVPISVTILSVFVIITACDKNTIPPVDHAKYSISEEQGGGDFAAHGSEVTYTCDEGYELVNASKNAVVCEYVPTLGDEQVDVNRRVRWTSADGIKCNKEGELQSDTNIYPIIYSITSMYPCTRSLFRFNAILYLS